MADTSGQATRGAEPRVLALAVWCVAERGYRFSTSAGFIVAVHYVWIPIGQYIARPDQPLKARW